MPRVVLDAVAVADLPDHLEIEHRALMETLGLQQLPLGFELTAVPLQFLLDRLDRPPRPITRGHEV
jgi:hypothetical protein